MLVVCFLCHWPAWLVCSWGMLAAVEAGGWGSRGRWSIALLGETLRMGLGETEKVEKVCGQPIWSSGRRGLWLIRRYPLELGSWTQWRGREMKEIVGSLGGVDKRRGGCSRHFVVPLGATLRTGSGGTEKLKDLFWFIISEGFWSLKEESAGWSISVCGGSTRNRGVHLTFGGPFLVTYLCHPGPTP